jgi:hypothetical protein
MIKRTNGALLLFIAVTLLAWTLTVPVSPTLLIISDANLMPVRLLSTQTPETSQGAFRLASRDQSSGELKSQSYRFNESALKQQNGIPAVYAMDAVVDDETMASILMLVLDNAAQNEYALEYGDESISLAAYGANTPLNISAGRFSALDYACYALYQVKRFVFDSAAQRRT